MDPSSRRGQLHQHATSSHGVGNLKPFCACRERPDLRSVEWNVVWSSVVVSLSFRCTLDKCHVQRRKDTFSVLIPFFCQLHTPRFTALNAKGERDCLVKEVGISSFFWFAIGWPHGWDPCMVGMHTAGHFLLIFQLPTVSVQVEKGSQ